VSFEAFMAVVGYNATGLSVLTASINLSVYHLKSCSYPTFRFYRTI